MKASELFVKCLEKENVKYVFGVPGEEIIDLMDSLEKSKIKFIATRHEEGAAFMANVYGRFTGEPGVCIATLGPGATNLVTGVADAHLDKAPLVAITGQVGLTRMYKDSHQYVDIVGIFKGITKWNKSINDPNIIPKTINEAFSKARSEKPGATHIELPENIASEFSSKKPLIPKKITLKRPAKTSIRKAITMLKKSKNPLIIAGNGVIREKASKLLLQFAKKNKIPVLTTFMGKGAISAKNDLHLGTVGLQMKDYTMCGLDRSDLIITVGRDLVDYPSVMKWNPEKNKNIIHIDTEHTEYDKHYKTSIDLVGDIKGTLKMMCSWPGLKKENEYSLRLKHFMESELTMYSNDKSFPMKPQKIIYDLRKALKDDEIIISDVGAHKMWLARLYPVYEPNTLIISNGFSAMGISLPGGIAAKLAKPKKKVVAVMGDGGFLMSFHELETAKRLGIDLVVIVLRDGRYGLIEWKHTNRFGKTFGTDFNNPDFLKLADSFGIKGYRIKKAKDFYPTLKKAMKAKGVNLIDVEIDSSENFNLTKKLGALVCPT